MWDTHVPHVQTYYKIVVEWNSQLYQCVWCSHLKKMACRSIAIRQKSTRLPTHQFPKVTLSSATCEEMCHIRLSLRNFMPYGPRSSERALISEKENKLFYLKHSFFSYLMPTMYLAIVFYRSRIAAATLPWPKTGKVSSQDTEAAWIKST